MLLILWQNILNLYMTFDLYYSWYGDQNATTKDNLFIEISTDGGNTWIATTAATPDTNIRISKIMDLLGVIPIL
jgi:hypothetical protein